MSRLLVRAARASLALSLSSLCVGTLSPPAELYSPLIQQKVFAIASNEPTTAIYPEYTDPTLGIWQYFGANNTWTTGFFPATLYALNTRANLCPNKSDTSPIDWLALGRQWSTGIIPFETNNGLEHDVGFVSFPFQDELQVLVSSIPCLFGPDD